VGSVGLCGGFLRVCAQLVGEYCVGLCWVMQYYYRGVPNWAWYYPYHYAPMMTDFVSLAESIAPMADKHAVSSWYW
jgi:5'-3' exonuclease